MAVINRPLRPAHGFDTPVINPLGATPPPTVIHWVQAVAGAKDTVSSTQLVIAVAAAVAAGDSLIGVVKISGGSAITGIVDSKGNAWAVDVDSASGSVRVFIVRSKQTNPLAPGDTITVNFDIAHGAKGAILNEYSGLLDPAPLDRAATGKDSTGTLTQQTVGPTAATTADGELFITAVGVSPIGEAFTPPAGYTERPAAGSDYVDMAELLAQPAGSTPSATWQWSAASSDSVLLAAYKKAP